MLKSLDTRQLALEFAARNTGPTYLARQFATYPFHICRPFWLENDPKGMATLYLQSCSGGLYGGERLSSSIRTRARAHAHVTTQASTIVHGLEGECAVTELAIDAEESSFLEVFNEPLILLPQASVENRVAIHCAGDAVVLYGDAFLVHDPEGKQACFGTLDSTVSVHFDGETRPSVLDRSLLTGSFFREACPGASGRWPVQGTLYLLGRSPRLKDVVTRALAWTGKEMPGAYVGGSELPFGSGAIFRIAADGAVAYRRASVELWRLIREQLFGITPLPRRK
mgnify:CR=1 FL=1